MPHSRFVLALLACGLFVCAAHSDDHATETPAKKVDVVVDLLELAMDSDETTARQCLSVVTHAIQNGQLSTMEVDRIRDHLSQRLTAVLQDESHVLLRPVVFLTTAWNDPNGIRLAREMFTSASAPANDRLAALSALIAAGDAEILNHVEGVLLDREELTVKIRGEVVSSLARSNQPEVPQILVSLCHTLEPQLQPRALEVLTQRPVWSVAMLEAIAAERIDKDALNLNQIQRMASMNDERVQELMAEVYGSVRADERGDRRRVVNNMRNFLGSTPGDPHQGAEVYKRVCGQCHKMYGEGAEVGPDITRNGRNDWMQLLYNVFDPSQVIGPGYQARILVTTDGRVLTGLAVEESEQRVVLKIQGGKIETIPRDQIEEYQVSDVSMMPEQLENQLKPEELADLFSFLALDKPPSDPSARYLPGAPRHDR